MKLTTLAKDLFQTPRIRLAGKVALDAYLAFIAWHFARIADPQADLKQYLYSWTLLAGLISIAFRLPRQHYRLFGYGDALRLAASVLGLGTLALCLRILAFLTRQPAPRFDTWITATLLTGALWALSRVAVRLLYDRLAAPSRPAIAAPSTTVLCRALIIGAGRAGFLMAQELKRHPSLGCSLEGFLDDAPDKQGVMIQGIPVLGTTQDLPRIVREYNIQRVILAMPSASGEALRKVADAAKQLGLIVKTVPGLYDLLGEKVWRPALRDLSIEDLLRREPVTLDQTGLSMALHDSVVLITGAGGSIGSELARQVVAFRPARVVLLGRGENSLWETERVLRDEFPNQTLALELCDIRAVHRLNQVFNRWKPNVVLHAAAHKHVPYLEQHAVEGVENNIFGTMNVLETCLAHGVLTFVNISTDKAVNPTNVLGATKRVAESLVYSASARAPQGSRYTSVRFGNVLGSRGSAIKIFQDQIRKGGPVTVTHPDMTRFFMTIPEASQLVLQVGLLGGNRKIHVLDMGKSVRILDLARDMIRLSGLVPDQDVQIIFSGIRPGEKLYEELFSREEMEGGSLQNNVYDAKPDEIPADLLTEGLHHLSRAVLLPNGERQREILRWLLQLVPTYRPSPLGLGRYLEGGPNHETASGPNTSPHLSQVGPGPQA